MRDVGEPELDDIWAGASQEALGDVIRGFEAPDLGGDTDDPPAEASRPTPKPTPVQGARILVADDLDLNRRLIADMLSIDGYEVDAVPDGRAAVEAAVTGGYELILMDMIMPGMDGLTAARAIRALPAPACHVPIVALTANCGRDEHDSCLQAGMNATLTKPMTFDSLAAAVSAWVRARTEDV